MLCMNATFVIYRTNKLHRVSISSQHRRMNKSILQQDDKNLNNFEIYSMWQS